MSLLDRRGDCVRCGEQDLLQVMCGGYCRKCSKERLLEYLTESLGAKYVGGTIAASNRYHHRVAKKKRRMHADSSADVPSEALQ